MSKTYKVFLEAEITVGDSADVLMAASQAVAAVGIHLIKEGAPSDFGGILDVPRGKAAYVIDEAK